MTPKKPIKTFKKNFTGKKSMFVHENLLYFTTSAIYFSNIILTPIFCMKQKDNWSIKRFTKSNLLKNRLPISSECVKSETI